MCDHCTRREFLGTGVAAGLVLSSATWTYALASESPAPNPGGNRASASSSPARPVPADRGWGADAGQIEAMKARLGEGGKGLGQRRTDHRAGRTTPSRRRRS